MTDPVTTYKMLNAVETSVCPNGSSRCTGYAACPFKDYEHIVCDVERMYEVSKNG